jgi:N-acetylglucosamine kinase-like BadF-type ATPase
VSRVGIAGVDVGGGGLRVCVEAGQSSARRSDVVPVARRRGSVDIDLLAPRIATAVESAADEIGVTRLTAIGIGLTGLPGLVEDPEELSRALRPILHVDSIVVASDAVTTHVGALSSLPGVVVAAGTGAIALGTDFDEVWNRVDGWGVLLGDEGGGAWIGMHGLKAALRARDGRPGGSSALLELMVDGFGYPPDLVAQVYRSRSAHRLASFAPAVAQAATAGDRVAERIWHTAAGHLAEAAIAAAQEVEPRFSWGGKLFDVGELLLAPFTAEISRSIPDARFSAPHGTSTDGALALAQKRSSGSALETRPPYLYVFGTPNGTN